MKGIMHSEEAYPVYSLTPIEELPETRKQFADEFDDDAVARWNKAIRRI